MARRSHLIGIAVLLPVVTLAVADAASASHTATWGAGADCGSVTKATETTVNRPVRFVACITLAGEPLPGHPLDVLVEGPSRTAETSVVTDDAGMARWAVQPTSQGQTRVSLCDADGCVYGTTVITAAAASTSTTAPAAPPPTVAAASPATQPPALASEATTVAAVPPTTTAVAPPPTQAVAPAGGATDTTAASAVGPADPDTGASAEPEVADGTEIALSGQTDPGPDEDRWLVPAVLLTLVLIALLLRRFSFGGGVAHAHVGSFTRRGRRRDTTVAPAATSTATGSMAGEMPTDLTSVSVPVLLSSMTSALTDAGHVVTGCGALLIAQERVRGRPVLSALGFFETDLGLAEALGNDGWSFLRPGDFGPLSTFATTWSGPVVDLPVIRQGMDEAGWLGAEPPALEFHGLCMPNDRLRLALGVHGSGPLWVSVLDGHLMLHSAVTGHALLAAPIVLAAAALPDLRFTTERDVLLKWVLWIGLMAGLAVAMGVVPWTGPFAVCIGLPLMAVMLANILAEMDRLNRLVRGLPLETERSRRIKDLQERLGRISDEMERARQAGGPMPPLGSEFDDCLDDMERAIDDLKQEGGCNPDQADKLHEGTNTARDAAKVLPR